MKIIFSLFAVFFIGQSKLLACEFAPTDSLIERKSEEMYPLEEEMKLLLKAGAVDVCRMTKGGELYLVSSWTVYGTSNVVKTVMRIPSSLSTKSHCPKNEIRSTQTNNYASTNYTNAVEELEKRCPNKSITQPVWNPTSNSRQLRLPGAYHEYGYWSARCDC